MPLSELPQHAVRISIVALTCCFRTLYLHVFLPQQPGNCSVHVQFCAEGDELDGIGEEPGGPQVAPLSPGSGIL